MSTIKLRCNIYGLAIRPSQESLAVAMLVSTISDENDMAFQVDAIPTLENIFSGIPAENKPFSKLAVDEYTV